ncbi:hypothetical protein GRAN_1583 [Granulicella sibirica]|uniref:Uncharacterized protein n=2 Tax=Granulicella sibirica TaxID=2479048 RepID=A0A4Q0T3T0_9BACT|nr:hypothetical protein GRAN_1583 [Granulicella sibirica]
MADGLRLVAESLDGLSDAKRFGWDHAILFTGHMIDAPDRKHPRFPASCEGRAREAMAKTLRELKRVHTVRTVGIAGGASGGDLLFHEECASLGIETLLRLTLPQEKFIETSVAPAGEAWVKRFHALVERLGKSNVEVLGDSLELPAWMGERMDYDVWQRTNLWLMQEAIARAPARSLLALWDGEAGDGPGGTQHLVEAALRYGTVVAPIIRTQDLID